MNTLAQQLEALLFTAGEAVPFSELKELTKASENDVQEALTEISSQLEGHGMAVVITDTHAELTTSKSVGEFLAQFIQEESKELSKAALETLSIIAYRGPVTRFDIDAIRGVDSRHMIKQLFAKGLIRQLKRSGTTPQYDITEEFLSHLGVTKKEELPQFESFKTNEHLTTILTPLS